MQRLVCLIVVLLLAIPGVMAAPADLPALAPQEQWKPILIDGESLPRAVGLPIEQLSLQAVVNGQLEPVPFQIDEYNTGGAVYFPGLDVPLDGRAGVLDPNDKLLFIYRDAGARRNARAVTDGTVLSEIELTDTRGIRRYVYLVQGSRLRSEAQYVRYSSELAQVETDFYSLVYNRENQINWDDFAFNGYQGEPPLDSMKLRMLGGLITDVSAIKLNNDNFQGRPIGENVGPVRTTSQMKVTVILLGLPLLDVSYQVHHYPKSMLYDVRVVMPEVRRKALSNPRLSISMDGNAITGGRLQTAIGPREPVVVDGLMSVEEQGLSNAALPLDDNWVWLSTGKRFDILAYFDYLGDTREPLSLVYVDDLARNDPPERFRGSSPNAGYRIDNFPESGFFGFSVTMLLSEGFEGDPKVFSQAMRSQPVVRVLAAAP